MQFLRRSLSEDSTDRLNHTWSLMLFLVLALITWLLPLSPIYQPLTGTEEVATFPTLPVLPTFEADCWCPSRFEQSMVSYTNSFCASKFNNMVNNNESVFYKSSIDPVPKKEPLTQFQPSVTAETIETLRQRLEDQRNIRANTTRQSSEQRKSTQYFISVRAPLILFVLALALKIPHLFWTVVSSCCSLNIDQTLDAAIQGHSMDRQSRRELHGDLAAAVAASIKSSPCSNSKLYLTFKMIVLGVVVIEMLYVGLAVLPEIDTQNQQLESISHESFHTSGFPSFDEDLQKEMNRVAKEIRGFNNIELFCDFSIRLIANIQHYTIQCIFTQKEKLSLNLPGETHTDNQVSLSTDGIHGDGRQNLTNLDTHLVVFSAVMAYLILLVVVDLFNLIIWIIRLLGSGRGNGYKMRKSLPMDAVLVLAMSHENASPLVTRELAQAANWGSDEKGSGEDVGLHEEKM